MSVKLTGAQEHRYPLHYWTALLPLSITLSKTSLSVPGQHLHRLVAESQAGDDLSTRHQMSALAMDGTVGMEHGDCHQSSHLRRISSADCEDKRVRFRCQLEVRDSLSSPPCYCCTVDHTPVRGGGPIDGRHLFSNLLTKTGYVFYLCTSSPIVALLEIHSLNDICYPTTKTVNSTSFLREDQIDSNENSGFSAETAFPPRGPSFLTKSTVILPNTGHAMPCTIMHLAVAILALYARSLKVHAWTSVVTGARP